MPSRPAVRADDKRLAEPGKKRKKMKGRNVERAPRSRMELWAAGELKVSEMSDKELEKGKFRNPDGSFRGGSRSVPHKFMSELQAERIKRWNEKVQQDLDPMRDVLREIALNPRAPADARHRSAIYLIERTVGKVPDKAEVKVEMAPWEVAISGILVDDEE